MQERVKTSFIPKASLKSERARTPSKSPMGLLNLISVILLILAIVGGVGAFLFQQFVTQSIVSKKASLEKARAAFEPATIKELSRLNARLLIGQNLLDGHVSFSNLFNEIEVLTLENVRFREFTLEETSPGNMKVSMDGTASSFNALAGQADAFGKSRILQESVFADFNVDAFGAVVFTYTATVNLDELKYTPSSSSAPAPEPIETTPPAEQGGEASSVDTQPEPTQPEETTP